MKKGSIKLRVTLWYAALMLILVIVVLAFMALLSTTVASGTSRDSLVSVVESNVKEVEYDDDGSVDIDDDFKYVSGGVTSVIYSAGNTLLEGHLPTGFETSAALEDGTLREIESGGQPYYLYDRLVTGTDGSLWVRGIVATDGSTGVISTVTLAAAILLPFIVLVAALVGYRITKRSFEPIVQITQAADKINEGRDLSKRINLREGADEIHHLAQTFDNMFARLEASFKTEQQFSSDVSHELRTPTTAILSQCEYALAHAQTEEEYREALETIQRQTKRMSQLVAHLLAFNRLDQGIEQAVFETTDISELVEMACAEYANVTDKGITLRTEIEQGILVSVDRALLVRLLSNLISNAYQYGKEGGSIRVVLCREYEHIKLSVIDDGLGIPEDRLNLIWNRFYQVDPSRSSGTSGSMGLGLAMVNTIAYLHGGHMHVSSIFGKGSTFSFLFGQNLT